MQFISSNTSNPYNTTKLILRGFREVHASPQIDENHTVQQVSADEHSHVTEFNIPTVSQKKGCHLIHDYNFVNS